MGTIEDFGTRAITGDQDVLRKNLQALAGRQPNCAPIDDDDRVRCIDGVWRLLDAGHPTGSAIHSRDPDREADHAVNRVLADGAVDIIVVVGLALGYVLDALERRSWTGKVLALEPAPETVRPFFARRDWWDWLRTDRLRVLIPPTFEDVGEAWKWFAEERVRVKVLTNPALAHLRAADVERAKDALGRIRFNAEANTAARRQFAPRYLLNTLRNLRRVSREGNVADLDNVAGGLPGIVVAAGPSLDRILPALRSLQQSVVIVAVDTALRPLLNAGVRPQFVVAVDPGEANARHLTDLPDCAETWLVCEASVDPFAIAPFAGRTFFFRVADHQPWPWARTYGADVGRLRAWGSVLTSAFDLALRMGCGPIVFAGADLAYTQNRPYARGLTYEQDWQRRATWGDTIEGQWQDAIDAHARVDEPDVSGSPVRTASHLVAFRDWLVAQIACESDRRFVNATGGGILHGAHLTQLAPESLDTVIDPSTQIRADLAQSVYRPTGTRTLVDAISMLTSAADTNDETACAWLRAWEQFAPGVSRADVLAALAAAVDDTTDRVAPVIEPAFGAVVVQDEWLQRLMQNVPLTPFTVAAHRLERAASGARVFRYRTMAGRMAACVAQPHDGGFFENGQPLRQVWSLDEVVAGTYSICRDEVHFRATDNTDPRWNGRSYSLLMPTFVAALEQLPIQEILDRRL